MFRAIFQGEHGDTVAVANPKLEAYKQAAYIQNVLGRRYRLTGRPGNVYTVAGDGLAALTFQPPARDTYVRCAHCGLLVWQGSMAETEGIALPGNHEPLEVEGIALPAETPVCPGSEMLGRIVQEGPTP